MAGRLSRIDTAQPDLIARATLRIDTPGPALIEITHDAAQFLNQSGAGDGALTAFGIRPPPSRSRKMPIRTSAAIC